MATKKRRVFSSEKKLEIIKEAEAGKTTTELSKEYEICSTVINRWKKEYELYKEEAFQGNGNIYKEESKIAELERKIGQLTMENEFLKKTLGKTKNKIKLMKDLGEI